MKVPLGSRRRRRYGNWLEKTGISRAAPGNRWLVGKQLCVLLVIG